MRNSDSGCVCRLCCQPASYLGHPQASLPTSGRSQWNQQQMPFNQSPPVGATASVVTYHQQQQQQQQQQHQRAAIPFQMGPGATYLEPQPQAQPPSRRRKRSAEPVDKIQRIYSGSTPWMDASSAFVASQAAWMTSVPTPLKFHC